MKRIFEITYIIGNIERTVVVMADNRSHAQGLVAATEPDDCTIFIQSCIQHPDNMVFQLNERRSPHVTN